MTLDAASDAAQGEAGAILESIARDLGRRLAVMVGRLDSTGGRLDPGQARQVRELAEEVRAYLGGRVPEALDALPPHLVEAAKAATDGMPPLGRFAPAVTQDLQRVWAGESRRIAAEISETAADEIASALSRAVAASTPLDQVAPEVARALSTSITRAKVAIDRGVRDFAEQAVIARGERIDAEIVYWYAGPVTGNIRPYCQARVNRVLTLGQAKELDPGARFNCRHNLVALTRAEAREAGLKPL